MNDGSVLLVFGSTCRHSTRKFNRDSILSVIIFVRSLTTKDGFAPTGDRDVLLVRATLDVDGIAIAIVRKGCNGSSHSPVLAFGWIG